MVTDRLLPQESTVASLFSGLLFEEPGRHDAEEEQSFASDLNLDQVVAAIVTGREEPEYLSSLFYRHLHSPDEVRYRQEVFSDLEDQDLIHLLERFVSQLAQVRSHLRQLDRMTERHQRQGWHLDAAAMYCDAVQALADDLVGATLESRGLVAFRSYLQTYVDSAAFVTLKSETAARKLALSTICYCIRIHGSRVEVTRYDDEADYSAQVLKTFERFQQGAVTDYLVDYRTAPGINHVTAHILELVARLFPDEFSALDEYHHQHESFFDDTVRRFERELQFYLAYCDYIAPLRSVGLSFCYPEVSSSSKEIYASNTFDLALARKLTSEGATVVLNDFKLEGPERIFVITGPNQGGKTTFARTFGQLHVLASLGCPTPGTEARLYLFDRLFTFFEREEDLARMSGKLEDDIVRVREILQSATAQSIVIFNEVFTSTTLHDAGFLGTKLLTKAMQLDLVGIYVTFVDELASLGDSVVSMMSTVVPEDPVRRTYKVVRRPADGLAYALAIAEKHDVTYEGLQRRLSP